MNEALKKCSKCKIEKLMINFHKDKKQKKVYINNVIFVGRNTKMKV